MGNTIRLGIATIGLVFNRWIAQRRLKQVRPVILILGRQEAGKSSVAFRIRNAKGDLPTTNYVQTNGFSVQDAKDKDTHVKLYDIGGNEIMRELWSHYYGDAHGFIYVIDSASSSAEIQDSAKILEQVLKDERVQGKPILILANKQDNDSALTEMEITNQMDLIRLVNTAKCLTRLDVCSAIQPTRPDSGIFVGFKWLISHIKWRWVELNDRVEHDALIEQRRENAKFEMRKEENASNASNENQIQTQTQNPSTIIDIEPMEKLGVANPLSVHSSFDGGDSISLRQRSDPDGGNEAIMTPLDEFSKSRDLDSANGRDIQKILVRAQVQVHEFTEKADSLPDPPESIPPLNPPKRKMSNENASPKKIKYFRNKTAPMELRTENLISYVNDSIT